MLALDGYWERTSRDASTGLYRWHDQLESGCDNLLTSICPSALGSGPPSNGQCWSASDAYTLASTDIMVFLYREKVALSNFLTKFGNTAAAAKVVASAAALKAALNAHLWNEEAGAFMAYNSTTGKQIAAKTHLLGFPIFGGAALVSKEQAQRSFAALSTPEMLSPFGIRSAASDEDGYVKTIVSCCGVVSFCLNSFLHSNLFFPFLSRPSCQLAWLGECIRRKPVAC